MKIILSREETLAAIIALEKEKKPYQWQQQAVAKLCKALGLCKKVEQLNKEG